VPRGSWITTRVTFWSFWWKLVSSSTAAFAESLPGTTESEHGTDLGGQRRGDDQDSQPDAEHRAASAIHQVCESAEHVSFPCQG
jgi:hypothetical protein